MPVDMKIWRIEGEGVQAVPLGGMDFEERLETIIDKDPSITRFVSMLCSSAPSRMGPINTWPALG